MNDRKGLNDEAENDTTPDCADAETAQPSTIETHGEVAYEVTKLDDGLVSYKPQNDACTYCKRADVPLRQAAHTDKPACGACAEIVERSMQARVDEQAGDKASPTPDAATALQAMRDALGVDVVTGLDLADAVRVGMMLGQLLASDADTRLPVDDLTDSEHDTLKHHVQDLLNRRRGVDPDHERSLLTFRWGSMSAWSLAMELEMDAQTIARIAARDDGVFSDAERDRLLDLLDDIVNERMGLASTEAKL
jgi:hypothetical protein